MIEYQHINRTFWMPSIKFKLEVEETKKISFYPIAYTDHYQVQVNNILSFDRRFSKR